MFEQLGLIGCGLMGGSFALACKRAGLVKRVVGYSKSPSTTERARQMGVIDQVAPSSLMAVSGSDLVLVAVPVAATEATLKAIKGLITPKTLVMDVGSTKRDVVDAARRVLREQMGSFVPAHPIAGKEVAGVEHADANLYKGAQVVLTPVEKTLTVQLKQAGALWGALGAKVLTMSPDAHDAAFAAVSHLPHLIAFALVNSIVNQTQGDEYLNLAGPGFRDFSRIAASDPQVWRDILIANKAQLLEQSQFFRDKLLALEHMIEKGDGMALTQQIAQASGTRAAWQLGGGKP
jgi:prephenate dehydrogenase